MKIKKTILSLSGFLGICVLFLLISTTAWAASPTIFYSDITSGPNTGGQNNLGVFVTIWGNNFGSTQGSSTVTVGGGAVANIQTWTNTEICFQLGSSAVTGNIVVTTSNGASNGIPFTVRSGNIYFVNPASGTNGTGTYASPFNHLYYAYSKPIVAGDTVYVMSGTISNSMEGYPGYHSILCVNTSGTQASPIAWVAYPNATVNLKIDGGSFSWADGSSGSGGDTAGYVFRSHPGASDWNTFAKFNIQATGGYSAIESNSGAGWRIVGNNITMSSYNYGILSISSNGVNANYLEVLGNEIHDSGTGYGSTQNMNHSIYWQGGGSNVEIGWNYMHGNKNAGYEISAYHYGTRVGTIHDNLIVAANAGDVRGINIGGQDSGESASSVYSQVISAYNNIIVNAGQYTGGNDGVVLITAGTTYFYNNTIYGAGTVQNGMVQFPLLGDGPGGGNQVVYFANNILYNTVSNNLYLSNGASAAPSSSIFSYLGENNYYGEGNGPSQDSHAINSNPLFVTAGSNFQLQATSPDINAGYNTTAIVARDYSGLLRCSTPTIGAYEYTSSSPSPIVAITSPSSGSSVAAGSNVTITTTATETNGTISKISLYGGSGSLLGSSTTSPYNYTVTGLVAGTYTYYAIATDSYGVSTTSSTITLTVTSGTPSLPVVSITSPANGSTYTAGSSVTFTTTASETNGTIANISLYDGTGVLLGYSSTSPFNYVYSNILAGSYTFYAVAKDVNGVSTTSSSITVTVTAPAPVVAITSPTSGSSFVTNSNITITATASETNGTISKVAFYNGSTLLGTDTSSPYTYTMSNVAAGSYSLTAVATDAKGVSTTSNAITVTVGAASVSNLSITYPADPNGQIVDSFSSTQALTSAMVTVQVAAPSAPTVWYTKTSDYAFISNGNNKYAISFPAIDYPANMLVKINNQSFQQAIYTIAASAGSGGTISPTGTMTVNSGVNQMFTLTPNSGYTASLTVDGTAVTLTNNAYTLSNVTAVHTVVANFITSQIETITASAGTGGTISPTGSVRVNYGANQTFTLTSNSGYTASLKVDGAAVDLTNNTYTLSNVVTAHTVVASFTSTPISNLSITYPAATNGQIVDNFSSAQALTSANVIVQFAAPSAPTVWYTITNDYAFISDGNNIYTLSFPAVDYPANMLVKINSQSPQVVFYDIAVSAGSGGTISPTGTVGVNSAASQTFTLAPNSGYTASLTVDGAAVTLTNNTYTLTNVTTTHTLAASFSSNH